MSTENGSAARKMLAALEECDRWDRDSLIEDEWPHVIEKMRSAIAAAKAAGIKSKE